MPPGLSLPLQPRWSYLTGKAVVKAMASKDIEVRAMVHSNKKTDEMLGLGASETIVGDIASYDDLFSAMNGIDTVYYICPTAREDEAEIGKMAIKYHYATLELCGP